MINLGIMNINILLTPLLQREYDSNILSERTTNLCRVKVLTLNPKKHARSSPCKTVFLLSRWRNKSAKESGTATWWQRVTASKGSRSQGERERENLRRGCDGRCGATRSALFHGPRTIVNPNERLLKSDPPDISRPRARAMARARGKRAESPIVSVTICVRT